jgi:hypothetical protein
VPQQDLTENVMDQNPTSGPCVGINIYVLAQRRSVAASMCPVEERLNKPYHRTRGIVYLNAETLGWDWGVHSCHHRQLFATTLGAVDALTIVLAARHPELWPYYAMCSTAGSVCGASVAYRLSRLGILHRRIKGVVFDETAAGGLRTPSSLLSSRSLRRAPSDFGNASAWRNVPAVQ